MDTITLSGIEINTIIGVYREERTQKQTLLIDLSFPTDAKYAARTDALSDAIDYGEIIKKVTDWAEATDYQLLESLAEDLADRLLEYFALNWVELSVHKPNVFQHVKDITLTIKRAR